MSEIQYNMGWMALKFYYRDYYSVHDSSGNLTENISSCPILKQVHVLSLVEARKFIE